jgi:opacity protein-like surface antigen
MKKLALCVGSMGLAALASAPVALADVTPEPLKWATGADIDWSKGSLLALFGLAGALFTVFTLVGGAVPGTAGQADLQAEQKKLAILVDQLEDAIKSPARKADDINAIGQAVGEARTALARERWRQFLLASSLYVLLGAFVAAVLAQDLLQAAAIGAGWTGIIGSLGLKRDYSARSETKDDALAALSEHLDGLEKRAKEPTVEVSAEEIRPSEGLLKQVEVAQAL